jgi:hypothetical protein
MVVGAHRCWEIAIPHSKETLHKSLSHSLLEENRSMKRKAHFQRTLASQTSFEKYGRKSRRKEFLSVMEVVVPWGELETLIEPHYPKAGNGRQPVDQFPKILEISTARRVDKKLPAAPSRIVLAERRHSVTIADFGRGDLS